MRTKLACRIVLVISAVTFAVAWTQGIRAQEPLEPAALSLKAAVPDEEAQKEATALVRYVYSEEYQQAKTAAEKAELARKLIEDVAAGGTKGGGTKGSKPVAGQPG